MDRKTAACEYAIAAMIALRMAKTEGDLIEWWTGEKQNRETLQLSPDTSPGLDLYNALKSYRNELRQKAMT
jgi:hypothetical protein